MNRWSLGVVAGLLMLGSGVAGAQDGPAAPTLQEIQDTPIDPAKLSLQSIPWLTLLEDPALRAILAKWAHAALPESLRERVTVEQIADGLGTVVDKVRAMPQNATDLQRAGVVAKTILDLVAPNALKEIEDAVTRTLDTLQKLVRKEGDTYVVVLPRAGALKILYEQPLGPAESTLFGPDRRVRRDAIKLQAENIQITFDQKLLDARGNVELFDRATSLRANGLRWDTTLNMLRADTFDLRLPSFRVQADQIETNLTETSATNLRAQATVVGIPVVRARAGSLDVGQVEGTFRNAELDIFGIRAYRKELQTFSMVSTGATGGPSIFERIERFEDLAKLLKPPTVNFLGRSPSIGYDNSYQFQNRALVALSFSATRGNAFESRTLLTYNLSGRAESAPAVIDTESLRSDFLGGYVQNAGIRNMVDFIGTYRRPRLSLLAGFHYNDRVELRGEEDIASQPFKIGFEFGGPIGSFGGVGQVRWEEAKSQLNGREQRASLLGSLGLLAMPLGRGLSMNARLDGAAYKPSGEGYAWIRPVVTLQARLIPEITLSGSYVNGREFGRPFSIADTYLAGPEYHVRFDFRIGPTQLTYANRYSARTRQWYRSQVYFSQDIDAFRLVVQTDQSLRQLTFGFFLRVDEIVDELRSRRYRGVAFDVDK
ncbi:MAG TPA: hypothetical protein PLH94_14020 [Fimbriimonadaceae bacterium]|nr:hypothetical protein [Fimbriimonadaceae bacterium]